MNDICETIISHKLYLNNDKHIKWGFIQPLTGGFYIGARKAIGHDADWIMSFPGFADKLIKKHKNGNETILCGNEYNLLKWLEKQHIKIPYYTFDRQPFDIDFSNIKETKILSDDNTQPNFEDIDLVIALPVCSGLSRITTSNTKTETRDAKNSNQLFITEYTLSVIKPKMYVYENAPALYSVTGSDMRQQLENIALEHHYSILYYKTDTCLHDNPQKRPRTFVIFQRWQENGKPQLPNKFGWEDIETNLIDYLDKIPEDATQQEPIEMSHFNMALLDYTKYLFGENNWREKSNKDLLSNITISDKYDDFKEFIKNSCPYVTDKEFGQFNHFLDHVKYKLSINKGYYSCNCYLGPDNKVGSIQFKSMQSYLNPKYDRHYTIREALFLMGMPNDFELQGTLNANFPKIGQNVPVRTAQFIISQIVKILEHWDDKKQIDERKNNSNVLKQDNTKQRIE